MKRFRPTRPSSISLSRLLPNIVTLLALCAGLTAIRFALQERWEMAVAAILVAAVLDGMDGGVARLLRTSSQFGAELDSLSDVIAFGVAPAMVIFLWSTQILGNIGWFPPLTLTVCCALRLARFNSRLDNPNQSSWMRLFFVGIPAPMGGALALLPVIITLAIPEANKLFNHPAMVSCWTLVVAFLMVSTWPTFSSKGRRVPQPALVPLLLGVGLVIAFFIALPWYTLLGLELFYLGTLPVSAYHATRLRRRDAHAKQEETLDQTQTQEQQRIPDPATLTKSQEINGKGTGPYSGSG